MTDERRRILELLAQGKVNVDEASELLSAIGDTAAADEMPSSVKARAEQPPTYLFVQVDSKGSVGKGEQVNIKIPLAVVKAGMKLGSVLPDSVSDRVSAALEGKGIKVDLKTIDGKQIDEVMMALKDLSIDVDEPGETVRIFCK